VVRDQREVIENDQVLCKPCAQETYFADAREVTWPDMNWKPETRPPCEQGEAGVDSLTQSRQGAKKIETNCY
jgi:hypothetical protein